MQQFQAAPLGTAAADFGYVLEDAIHIQDFERGIGRGRTASVAQSGVADADASLASLAGEKRDDDLNLGGAELAEEVGEKADLFESLAGVGDAARGVHHA